MQWLAAICVRRPVFTWVLMLSLVVIGVASIGGLGVDRFPNVDFPIVVVTTILPGASPEQMETEVSDRLEESINTISSIDELRSTSFEGLSVIVVQFTLEKNRAVGAQEVRDRVNRTLSQLPRDIEQPRVEPLDPDAAPVMLVALSGNRSLRELTEYASRGLRRQIESLDGVGGVTVLGGRARQINVTLDPARLQTNGLTAVDVQRALSTQNVEVPGGAVFQGNQTYQLRVQGRVRTIEELNDISIVNRGGLTVHLRDVGAATDSEADPTSLGTINGRETVILAVRKQSGTNTVAVIEALKQRVDELRPNLPAGFRLQIVRDESEFVQNAIHSVEEHLVIGSLFAALVVLLFLWNGRSTLISALAIPTSVISTFALMKMMGLTLNVITLLALTLSVGIVIDDAIVVLENIVRFIEEKGMTPRRAAVLATKEIGLAVLATTLSLVAVFLPIAFMSGIIGRFMSSFGFTMSFAIVVSLFVSFTLTPMLSARWLKRTSTTPPKEIEEEPEESLDSEFVDPAPEPRAVDKATYREWRAGRRQVADKFHSEHGSSGLYGVIERGYMKLLAISMGHRWIIGIAMIGTLAATVPLVKAVQKNFLPIEDESRFEITISSPEGTSLRETQIQSDRLARVVRQIPGVAYTVNTVGSPPGDPSGRAANQAALYVSLDPAAGRQLSQSEIIIRVRDHVLPMFRDQHMRVIVGPVSAFGGGGAQAAAIQYVIRGPELDHLEQYSTQLLQRMRAIPGVVDADTTFVTGSPEFTIRIDRARAADVGVSVSDVANALRLLVGDVQVTTYNESGEQYEVHIRATDQVRMSPDSILQATIPTATPGRTVRLADIVSVTRSTGPTSILRLARQRQVMIYGNVLPGTSEANVLSALDLAAHRDMHMDPGYVASPTGRSRELARSAKSFLVAVSLSLVFMYLVLAAQFESWIHPLTILMALPLTFPFGILALIVFGQSMNIFSALGVLVLFGIVKKNSILQVDHMRDLRRRGLSRADAVMIGNRDRLRPILMTTVAFVAGMIPLVVSSGAGSGTNRAVGTIVIGGQTLSLLLTLLATPMVYTAFDDLAHSWFVAFVGRAATWPFRTIDKIFGRKSSETAPASTHTPADSAAE